MDEKSMFANDRIAKEARRIFGGRVKSITVPMKYQKEVNEYINKIDLAHKRASSSNLVFK